MNSLSKFLKSFKTYLIIFLLFLLYAIWPIKFFLTPNFLFQKNLILFTNEAELRPCGGFLTTYATLQILPPKLEIKNSYSLNQSFEAAEFPLNKITENKNFWDLGTTTDLKVCASTFEEYFELMSKQNIKNVILVDFSTIENLIDILGYIKIDNEIFNSKNFFAKMTRMVADVDRHDEKSLEKRKSPLGVLGKILIKRCIFKFWKWPAVTQLLKQNINSGKIFIPNISPDIEMKDNDFSVVEWNLGGAKTSRVLQKKLKINIREIFPEEWKIDVFFVAENLGIFEEPLAQTWKGGFEFYFPFFLDTEKKFIEAKIAPGDMFEQNFSFVTKKFPINYELNKYLFGIFNQRGQKLFTEVNISLFPQKKFKSANFSFQENIGRFYAAQSNFRKIFLWDTVTDRDSPFVSLHEKISLVQIPDELKEKFESNNFLVELHFNENVKINNNFLVKLVDRNFVNQDTENLFLKNFELLDDYRTLILGFTQKKSQDLERYFLELSGVEDFFGNKIKKKNRTIIDR